MVDARDFGRRLLAADPIVSDRCLWSSGPMWGANRYRDCSLPPGACTQKVVEILFASTSRAQLLRGLSVRPLSSFNDRSSLIEFKSDDALSIQCDNDLSNHTKQRVARAPEYCQFKGAKQ